MNYEPDCKKDMNWSDRHIWWVASNVTMVMSRSDYNRIFRLSGSLYTLYSAYSVILPVDRQPPIINTLSMYLVISGITLIARLRLVDGPVITKLTFLPDSS